MSGNGMNHKFKEEDLKTITKARQKEVLVKHTTGDSDASVQWVSFHPWQNNTVEWENNFDIHSPNRESQSGAAINKCSDQSETEGV